MMQMLRFRGGSSASKDLDPNPSPSPSPSPSTGLASPSPSSSRAPAVAPGRPLRLVYCDGGGKFRMDPEAVAALHLVKGPVGVVSVCGRARQGKSFVLNQLLGRSSGFQVASTHRPCTKGLWMWSAPIKQIAVDGTEYSLLLLDSEGIDAYDQTGTYSTQIFSLAVLLSSMFIYNQMGGIDEAALDRLSLVTEMTKHIRVRAIGGRSTVSELGQFSPVFVWLLRDFYLDLAEDNRKITPRDYLELALRPIQGRGKDISSKNEIRESIRALFPDRECFTLVRPLNNENELQRLDQIPLDRLRPEFRAGLDQLTKFVFERTRPKQVGATVMTGPVLAGVIQSFLDAINNGAVPTISSSWQSVEEAECRRAYDFAAEVYMSSFDRNKPAEEGALREAHEDAFQKSLASFNAIAVGAGSARMNYEKLLQNFCKKAMEDFKRNAFLEADKQCSSTILEMEKKLRAKCLVPGVKVASVIEDLENLILAYESSCHGPGKWKIMSAFLRQCLEGPILDLCLKQINHSEAERNALVLKFRSNEDKLELLRKQLEANEKHKSEYLKRFEHAINEKQTTSTVLSSRVANLRSKCSTLEERCVSMSKDLDLVRRESTDWRTKYEQGYVAHKADEEKLIAQRVVLESRYSAAEGKVAAVHEQAASAQEEASEWRQKYEVAAAQSKTSVERTASAQDQANKIAQEREDLIRAEFGGQLEEKDEEIKKLKARFERAEMDSGIVVERLQGAETILRSHDRETAALRNEIKDLNEILEVIKHEAWSYEKEAKIVEQEKNNLQEKYLLECKRFDEADERCKSAEGVVKRATELVEAAQTEVIAAQKEKNEAQQLSMERLTVLERIQRQVDNLEQGQAKLLEEMLKLRQSEMDASSKVALLEKRVEEREKEIEELMNRSNEQRSSTVHVLENLLSTERAARADAENRAAALSLQLQSSQGKLDLLHQELTSIQLVETALDSKLRAASRGKRSRVDNDVGTESVHNMDADGQLHGRKRSRSTTGPGKNVQSEDGGSVYKGEGNMTQSLDLEETEPEDYTKFTVLKLKQELTKHGFGVQVLYLRSPNKKDLLSLYEKHVLGK